jgi:hypothetical protein
MIRAEAVKFDQGCPADCELGIPYNCLISIIYMKVDRGSWWGRRQRREAHKVVEVTEKPVKPWGATAASEQSRPYNLRRRPAPDSLQMQRDRNISDNHTSQDHPQVGELSGWASTLAPSFGPEPRNPQQGLGLTEERHAQIYARYKHISRTEFCRDAVCHSVVGVVERAAIPVIKTSGP